MNKFNTACFVLASTLIFIATVWPHGAHSQDLCIQDSQPHYYVAEGTVKTTIPNNLQIILTPDQKEIWSSTFRNFVAVSPVHQDLAACNDALEMLTAQRNIPIKAPIHAVQSLSYQGRCLPTVICQ